ncbi:hypothetical protein BG015_011273 [Linnemannia schmuckeri]|uniref:GH16 domain-containing protein n=1 Tax=Linnemannia schmuckeri TaxID=64567 RepID=A0A9P5S8F7_9FUNG|nr:hypothetical protein BG015_011273 [Linnemannia schmuckeri]
MRFAPLALLLPMGHFWVSSVDGSLFSSSSSSSTSTSTNVAPSCGPSYSPCPVSYPCCNNGTCHKTTLQACPIALGCQPAYSYPIDSSSSDKKSTSKTTPLTVNSCFPLPVCRSFKEKFKSNQPDKHGQHRALIPKHDFLGDPDQAHWTSDFDHIVDDHAVVDTKHKKLVLKAKRDEVKTKSGGGFGATVSSTRWNRYGTFATQFKAGSTGPGIVTAFMLTNPALGEEISFQITGRDPKTVLTEYYKHPSASSEEKGGQGGTGGKGRISSSVPGLHWPHLPSSATENDLVYKIEWTPDKIAWSVDGRVLRTLRAKDLLQRKNRHLEIPSQPMQIQLTIWDAGHSKDTKAWAGGVTDYGENDEKEYVTLVDWIEIACYDNKEAKRNPWPGKDASARLAQVEAEERKAEEEKEARKKDKAKKDKEAQKAIDAAAATAKGSSTIKRWMPFGSRGNASEDSATTVDVKSKSKKQLKQEEKQRKKAEKSKKQAAQKEKEKQAREPGVLSRFSDRVIRILLRWNFIVLFLVATGSYLTEPVNARKFHLASKEKLGLQQ